MATFVFTDAYLLVNSVDLSTYGIQLTVDMNAELLDNTAFGHTARTSTAGLKVGGATIVFLQDYAATKVDATLQPLVGAAAFPFAWQPDNSVAISTSNPEYQANMVVESYQPVGEGVGDQAKASITLVNASSAGWVRDVTP
tara:strand:- start:164 stop:586 length:423 start_codon:yes stop_codon:yes gene_type:complete